MTDAKDCTGQTPLSWAARNGHEEIVELLLDRKDIKADSKDDTARLLQNTSTKSTMNLWKRKSITFGLDGHHYTMQL